MNQSYHHKGRLTKSFCVGRVKLVGFAVQPHIVTDFDVKISSGSLQTTLKQCCLSRVHP